MVAPKLSSQSFQSSVDSIMSNQKQGGADTSTKAESVLVSNMLAAMSLLFYIIYCSIIYFECPRTYTILLSILPLSLINLIF